MAPYAEAGDRSLLFSQAVYIDETGSSVVITAEKPAVVLDLQALNERPDPLTVESDILGIVYKNGDPTSGPVSVPKTAVFEVSGKP